MDDYIKFADEVYDMNKDWYMKVKIDRKYTYIHRWQSWYYMSKPIFKNIFLMHKNEYKYYKYINSTLNLIGKFKWFDKIEYLWNDTFKISMYKDDAGISKFWINIIISQEKWKY